MRIIRGNHRGRRINPPANLPVRPTTDMAKESLFNMLENEFYFEELKVLDLFAGTGNISYEFASRGALEVISVDNNPRCIQFIRETADKIGFGQIVPIRTTALGYVTMTGKKFDIIFADPPYDLNRLDELADIIFSRKLLADDGVFVMEHGLEWNFTNHPQFDKEKKYGRVHFSFFRAVEA